MVDAGTDKMLQYAADDILIREISNGVWGVLATLLTIGLLRYAYVRWSNWKWDITVCGSLAMAIYLIGTIIRVYISWGTLVALRHPDWPLQPWLSSWPWYMLSLIISIFGAIWCIWAFAPKGYKLIASASALAIALIVPAVVTWVI